MALKISADAPAQLRVLHDGEADECFEVRLISSTGRQLLISGAPASVAARAAVQIEWSEHLILGEVVQRQQDQTTVLIRHLLHPADIAAMRQGWT